MMTAIFLGLTTTTVASTVVDRIVAVVNEDIILLSELNSRMGPYAERIQQQVPDEDKQQEMLFKVREDMLNRLVDEKLTDQEIKRNDIQVDEAQIDATIERIKSANYFTDEDLASLFGAGTNDHGPVSQSDQGTDSENASGQL